MTIHSSVEKEIPKVVAVASVRVEVDEETLKEQTAKSWSAMLVVPQITAAQTALRVVVHAATWLHSILSPMLIEAESQPGHLVICSVLDPLITW